MCLHFGMLGDGHTGVWKKPKCCYVSLPFSGDCNFQYDNCQWTIDSNGSWQWSSGSGQSHENNSAPMFDHSGSPTGLIYLFFYN